MAFFDWKKLFWARGHDRLSSAAKDRYASVSKRKCARLLLEGLEDRITPASSLTLDIQETTISEAGGVSAVSVTVTLDMVTPTDLDVTITSSDLTELRGPTTVTIPANSDTVSFSMDTVNDGEEDGDQTVTVTASATGLTDGTDTIDVTDDDTPTDRTVGGHLMDDITAHTYTVTHDIVVEPTVTLNIAPDSTLLFGMDLELVVNGTLSAPGTALAPIVFTSSEAVPTPGHWVGITIAAPSEARSLLDHVEISYAQIGLDIPSVDEPQVTLQNSDVHHNSDRGVAISSGHRDIINPEDVLIQNNNIYDNGTIGVSVEATARPDSSGASTSYNSATIQNNEIYNNGGAGIHISAFLNSGAGFSTNPTANPVIIGNRIHHNDDGIVASSATSFSVFNGSATANGNIINNFITDNTGDGISYTNGYRGRIHFTIVNNTVARNGGAGIGHEQLINAWSLQNNIVAFNNTGIEGYEAINPSTQVSHNNVFGNGTNWVNYPASYGVVAEVNFNDDPSDVHFNISFDPEFVSTTDYHLQITSKSANAGLRTGAPSDDIDGELRHDIAVDIGADEADLPPFVYIRRVGDEFTNASAVVFDILFSEAVSNVDVTDFEIVVSGTVTTSPTIALGNAGDNDASTWTISVSNVNGNGTLGLDIDDQNVNILDGTNQQLLLTPRVAEEYTIDNVDPTLSITYPVQGTRYTPTTWSDIISGTAADAIAGDVASGLTDVQVRIQRLSDNRFWDGFSFVQNFSGSVAAVGTDNWTFPLSDFHLSNNVSYSVFAQTTDLAGNQSSVQSVTFTYDNSRPMASFEEVSPDLRNTNVGIVAVNFTEAVTGVDISDFTLERDNINIDISGLTVVEVNPLRYTIDLTSVANIDGNYRIELNATGSGIEDDAGNPILGDAEEEWEMDTTDPFAPVFTQFLEDNGVSNSDRFTNDLMPYFEWTGADNVNGTGVASYWYGLTSDMPELDGTNTTANNVEILVTPGTHTFYVKAVDGAGNIGPVSELTFTIDATLPTAQLTSAPNVPDGAQPDYFFDVTYADELGLNAGTSDGANVRVIEPGFEENILFPTVSNVVDNGTEVIVTYQLTAPGGFWNIGDNGTYRIETGPNGFEDDAGNPVPVGIPLGSFHVSVNNLPYEDSFDNPTEEELELGPVWRTPFGEFVVTPDGEVNNATNDFSLSVLQGVNEADVEVLADVIVDDGQSVGLVARHSGSGLGSFYMAWLTNDGTNTVASLHRYSGNQFNQLASATIDGNPSEGQMRFEIVDSSLRLFFEDSLETFVNDFALTSGSVGIAAFGSPTLDDFKANPIIHQLDDLFLDDSDNFDQDRQDEQLDPQWATLSGNFRVTSDIGDKAQGNSDGFSLAVRQNLTVTNVNVSTEFSVNATDNSVGLVLRHEDSAGMGRFYMAWLTYNGTNTSGFIFYFDGVTFHQLNTDVITGTVNTGTLRFEALSTSMRLFVGDTLMAFASHEALESGSVGIAAYGKNVIHDTYLATLPTLSEVTTLPDTDTFDQDPIDQQLGDSWRTLSGNFKVRGQFDDIQANSTGLSLAVRNKEETLDMDDVSVQAQFTINLNQSVGLVLRHTDGPALGNFYLAWLINNSINTTAYIFVKTGSTYTQLASTVLNGNVTTGTLRFQAIGTSLKLFINNNLRVFASDATLTTGTVGMMSFGKNVFLNDYRTDIAEKIDVTSLPDEDEFDHNPTNKQLDSMWSIRAGGFTVDPDTDDAKGNIDHLFSMAVRNGMDTLLNNLGITDVAVEANFNIQSGQSAGLVARHNGKGFGSFYLGWLIYSGNTTTAYIYHISPVETRELYSKVVETNLAEGEVVEGLMRFEAIGTSLKFYIDDTLKAFAHDGTLSQGKVGIATYGQARIDNYSTDDATPDTATLDFIEEFDTPQANKQLDDRWVSTSGNFTEENGQITGSTTADYNMAVLHGINQGDVSIYADVKLEANQSAGLVGRYGGPGSQNFYLGFVYYDGTNITAFLYLNLNGQYIELAKETISNPNTEATLEFHIVGNSLTLTYDGTSIVDTDSTLSSGSVGVFTVGEAAVKRFEAND